MASGINTYKKRSIYEISSVCDQIEIFPSTYYTIINDVLIKGIENSYTDKLKKMAGTTVFNPAIHCFKLKDAIIVDQGIVLTSDGFVLSESLADTKPGLENKFVHFDGKHLLLKEDPKTNIENGHLLKKRGQTNYGHWLVELLLKQYAITRYSNINTPAIVHNSIYDFIKKMYIDSLSSIGTENVVMVGSEPARISELYYMVKISEHPTMKHPLLRDMCREIITACPAHTKPKNDLIYLSRSKNHKRNIVNSQQVHNFYEDIGYHIIDPSSLSFRDQVAMFSSATSVIGIMGAAMVNAIFSPNVKVAGYLAPESMNGLFYLDQDSVIGKSAFRLLNCKNAGIRDSLFDDLYVDMKLLKSFQSELEKN